MAEKIGLEGVLDLSNFDKGISSYLSGVKKMEGETGKATGSLSKGWDNMGKSVLNAATLMSKTLVAAAVAGGAAVAAFVVGGIKGATDLEAQLGGIAAVLNLTKDEVEPLKQLIFDLGIDPNLKVDAQQAADAIELLARNGLTAAQIMDGAAKATVLLANATGAEFGTAADIATDVMAIFKIEAGDMMDAVNGITSVTTASKFSINDYRLALAQGGGVAAAVGVEFNDFNATIAAISPLFASGSDAGTSLKTMLLRLAPATDKAAGIMQELGIITADGSNRFFDAGGNLKDMSEISRILNGALSDLTEEQKNTALATLFGTDAMRAAVGLAESGEVAYTDQALAAKELGVSYDSLTDAMENGLTTYEALQIRMGQTDAAESAKVRMDNFAGSLEILKGVIDTIALRIGFAFLPMLNEIAKAATALIDQYADPVVAFFENMALAIEALVSGSPWQEVFPAWLVGTIQTISANMHILTGALGGIAILLATAGISAALSAIGAALATLLSPIGLLVIGAAALGIAWNTNFLGIRDITLSVVSAVMEAFAPLTAAISAFGTESLAEIWAFVTGNAIGFAATAAIWNGAVESVQNLFNSIVAAVTENLPTWIAKLLEWGAAAANWISIASALAVTKIGEWATAILGALAANLPTWIAKMLEWSATLVNWIGLAITNGAAKLTEWASALLGTLAANLPAWIAKMLEWSATLTNWIGIAITASVAKLGEWATAILVALSTLLPGWIAKMLEWSATLSNWIGIAITASVAKLGEWATAVLGALAANLPTWIAKMLEWSATLVNWIGLAIAGSILKLGEWATALVTWISGEGTTQLTGSTTGMVSALIDWITTDLIPKVGPKMLEFGLALGTAVANIAMALGLAALSIGSAIWAAIMVTDWKTVGSNILTAIQAGWDATKVAVLTALGAIATSIKDKFTTVDWKAAGTDALNLIKDGWQAVSASVQLAIALIATAIKDKFTSIDWKAVGTASLTAIKDGWEATKTTVLPIIGAVATGIKNLFIAVPWKQIGTDALTLIKDGVEFAKTTVLPAIGAVAASLMEKFTSTDWNQVGKDIATAIKNGLKTAAELLGGLISIAAKIVTDIIAKFTSGDWTGTGTSIMTTLATAVKAAVALPAGLMYVVGQIALGMLEEFTGIDFAAAALTMMTALATGIRTAVDAAEGLLAKVGTIAGEIVTAFTSVDWVADVGTIIMNKIRDGIVTAAAAADGLVAKALATAKSVLKQFTDIEWVNIGTQIVGGIKKGISDAQDSLKEYVMTFLRTIMPGWAHEALGIASPSKVFAEIGRNIVQGLIVGIESEQGKVSTAMSVIARSITNAGAAISPSFAFGDRAADWIEKLQESADRFDPAGLAAWRSSVADRINRNTFEQSSLLMATDVASIQRFNELRREGVALLGELADVDKALVDSQDIRQRIGNLTWYTNAVAEAEQRLSVLTDKVHIFTQAAALGIDIGGLDGTTNVNEDTLRQMMQLEQEIADARSRQISAQITQMQQEQRLGRIIDKQFLNPAAAGSFATRFRTAVVDPLLAAVNASKDAFPIKQISDYYQAAGKLMQLGEAQTRSSFLKEQIGLLREAADLGLNLSTLMPDGLIGNMNNPTAMLDIAMKVAQAQEAALYAEAGQLKNAQKLADAMKELQPIIDQTDVSSVFGKQYKATVLDPILASLEKAAGIDAERVRLINEYRMAAQKLVEIQAKERQLAFLQQQLDMIRMVHDDDLPGSSTMFDGLALGINASITDLTTLTSRVIDAMIRKVKDQLEIASPSKVFMRIGSNMMAGLAEGIQSSVMRPINSLQQATMAHGDVSTRTLNFAMGGVTINSQMDEVMFESRVLRILDRAMG